MPRPQGCRRISGGPAFSLFKPAGTPARALEKMELTLDELEAMRLADLEGLYQEEAAERMGVSRPTFGRIVESARRKVTEALVVGKALAIRGGAAHPSSQRCPRCRGRRRWASADALPEGDQGNTIESRQSTPMLRKNFRRSE